MKISELIKQLGSLKDEHGDDDVWFYRDGEYVGLLADDISFCEDSYEGEETGLYIGV